MGCGCNDNTAVASTGQSGVSVSRAPALVLERNDVFPANRMPESGVGSMTVHTLRGTVVAQHTIDVRDRATFVFSDDEVARIITGLLSEQSFDAEQRISIAEESQLRGTYVMAFPDHEDVVGDVTALVRQKGVVFTPRGCGCASGCACRRPTHTTTAALQLSAPKPVEVTLSRVYTDDGDCDDCDDNTMPSPPYPDQPCATGPDTASSGTGIAPTPWTPLTPASSPTGTGTGPDTWTTLTPATEVRAWVRVGHPWVLVEDEDLRGAQTQGTFPRWYHVENYTWADSPSAVARVPHQYAVARIMEKIQWSATTPTTMCQGLMIVEDEPGAARNRVLVGPESGCTAPDDLARGYIVTEAEKNDCINDHDLLWAWTHEYPQDWWGERVDTPLNDRDLVVLETKGELDALLPGAYPKGTLALVRSEPMLYRAN